MAGKKVEIEITDMVFSDGNVGFSVVWVASRYGGGLPANPGEVEEKVMWARKNIIEEGDIPVVRDLRKSSNIMSWLGGAI